MGWLQDLLKAKQSPQNLKTSPGDSAVWREASAGSETIAGLMKAGEDKLPTWGPLLQDVFHTYWKPQPELADPETVDQSHLANRPLLEGLMSEPATEETRSFSVLDETISAIAALAAGQKLVEAIEADPNLNDAAQNLQNSLKKAPPQPDGSLGPAGQQAVQDFQNALSQSGSAFRKAMRQASRAAAQKAEEVQQAIISWGLDAGEMTRVPIGERVQLAELLATPRFKKIGELIGRLRNLGRSKQRDRLRHLSDEIHSITQGDDLARLLPVELGALSQPARRLDFGRRLIERQLLEYDLKPRHKDKRGPIIALIDRSGSMTEAGKIEWAAACGLALLDIARRQKRDFAACYFDTEVAPEFRFPRGAMTSAKDVVEFATVAGGGGTDFAPPLRWALDLQAESAFDKADIVMIGDGECRLGDDFRESLLATKKARGIRIFSILIGGVPEEMGLWSDRIWALTQPDDAAAGEMFEEI